MKEQLNLFGEKVSQETWDEPQVELPLIAQVGMSIVSVTNQHNRLDAVNLLIPIAEQLGIALEEKYKFFSFFCDTQTGIKEAVSNNFLINQILPMYEWVKKTTTRIAVLMSSVNLPQLCHEIPDTIGTIRLYEMRYHSGLYKDGKVYKVKLSPYLHLMK